MTLRKVATALVAVGLMSVLVGAGISAQYSDNAVAIGNVHVGAFACHISSTDPTAQVASDGHSVAITLPAVTASTGSAATVFTVTNSGAIAEVVHVTVAGGGGNFTALPQAPATDVTLAPGAAQDYTNAGLSWAGLDNSAFHTTATATYTANCGEVPTTHHVNAVAPTASDETCSASGSIFIPDVEGVDYFLDGNLVEDGSHSASNGPHTVTAAAEDGYTLDGYPAGGWTLVVQPKSGCEIAVTPAQPTAANETCSASGKIVIPAVAGVDYFLDGVAIGAGSHNVANGSHTVTAVAQTGYVLDGYPAGGWNLVIQPKSGCSHISYIGFANAAGHNALAFPAGTQAGDLAIVMVYTSGTPAAGAPAGYTVANSTVQYHTSLSWKVLVAGDIAGGVPASTNGGGKEVAVYRGAVGIGASTYQNFASGLPPESPNYPLWARALSTSTGAPLQKTDATSWVGVTTHDTGNTTGDIRLETFSGVVTLNGAAPYWAGSILDGPITVNRSAGAADNHSGLADTNGGVTSWANGTLPNMGGWIMPISTTNHSGETYSFEILSQ